jgi:Ran GTPase-activating protein (RanGAP) involved in mRNA processing and transport
MLSDQGVATLMEEISQSLSIATLNLASNEITNEGMLAIFRGLMDNESVSYLNVATIEGVARNRISASGIDELKQLLKVNKFIEILDISSVGLGNSGLEKICEVLG